MSSQSYQPPHQTDDEDKKREAAESDRQWRMQEDAGSAMGGNSSGHAINWARCRAYQCGGDTNGELLKLGWLSSRSGTSEGERV